MFPIDYILPTDRRGDGPEYLYYAGLLGKPTKHLTYYGYNEVDGMWSEKYTFTWQFDNKVYPIKLKIIGIDDSEYNSDEILDFDYIW